MQNELISKLLNECIIELDLAIIVVLKYFHCSRMIIGITVKNINLTLRTYTMITVKYEIQLNLENVDIIDKVNHLLLGKSLAEIPAPTPKLKKPGIKMNDTKVKANEVGDFDDEDDTSEVDAEAVKIAAKAYAKEVGRDEAKQIMNENGASTLAKIDECTLKQRQAMFKAFTASL